MTRWLAPGLAFLFLGVNGGQGAPVLPGTLAYIHRGAVYVAPTAGGPARPVAGSRGALVASMSPAGGTVLFFTGSVKSASRRGFVSRAPYTRSQPLPAPLDRVTHPGVVWSPEGATAFVSTATADDYERRLPQLSYTPADGRVRKEPFQVDTASRNRQVTAWADFRKVALCAADGKAETVVTGDSERKAVLAALKSARFPTRLKHLQAELKEEAGLGQSWAVGSPALSADGQALFFACNAGGPVGATGGTTYCLFKHDVVRKKLTALSGLGDFETLRMPEFTSVSPDGKRLLFVTVGHGSAIQNTRMVYLVDLETQRSREVLARSYTEDDSNLTKGSPCWSPDSRYVAADVFSYRIEYPTGDQSTRFRLRKPEGGWGERVDPYDWDPSDSNYAVLIFDAATGREVRRIPHAMYPSWSR